MPPPASPGQEGVHSGEIPHRLLVGPPIPMPRRAELREHLPAGPTPDRRVLFSLDAADPVQRPSRLFAVGAGCAARPTAGSGRWTAPLWDCAWAGPGDSRSVRPPARLTTTPARGGRSRDEPQG